MITDVQRNLIIEQHRQYGIEKKEIRSYEVSLWTLQDSFITVLKWSDVEQKGRIEHPKMILDVDGTQEFSFSIPMYYRRDGVLIENPNWRNTLNKNLMTGLRKIKVIFNKDEAVKQVFEFVILDIQETHSNDMLTCEVKCEGLAFHELGKIGYKLVLSFDEFYERYKKWCETGKDPDPAKPSEVNNEPRADIAYWCRKAGLESYEDNKNNLNPNTWYYRLQMNWNSFEQGASGRSSMQLYEETYTTAWNDDLVPTKTKSFAIKQRMVDAKNSNIYNITQTIAETFGVFCTYEYGHDQNNQIISRTVVFYNNYFKEEEGYMSLTYPYSATEISRRMDSTDLTTKLYVLNVDDDTTLQGYHTIMDSEANKTKEDYILNFDYLHSIGTISDEQYAEIPVYEKKMKEFNEKLIPLQQKSATLSNEITEVKAQLAIAENSKKLDQEQVDATGALRTALLEKYGNSENTLMTRDNKKPAQEQIFNSGDNTTGYISLRNDLGIILSTVHVYKTGTYNSANQTWTFTDEITGFVPEYDKKTNAINRLTNLPYDSTKVNRVYLTYNYNPSSYYDSVIEDWQNKLNADTKEALELENKLGKEQEGNTAATGLYAELKTVDESIDDLITKKNKCIKAFERMMGPALREGYWQPEDYTNYGDTKEYNINPIPTTITAANNDLTSDLKQEATFIWDVDTSSDNSDSHLFTGEQKLYYEKGVKKIKEYYPMIEIPSGILMDDITKYSIYFNTNYKNDTVNPNGLKYQQYFAVGSQAIPVFVKNSSNEIIPALVLVGAKSLTDDQITKMKNTDNSKYYGHAKIGELTLPITGNALTVKNAKDVVWLETKSYKIVMPRIRFSSTSLKTQSDDITIQYNNQLLSMFEDYYVNTRDIKRGDTNYMEYFITLKPESMLRYCGGGIARKVKVNYIISNANTTIYLDALEVSHENAYPKVSYDITTNLLNPAVSHTLYSRLAQLLMINDTELKFENTFGYISHMELDLDAPQNDTIEVKNYKTKFEDLFSTIVAQTEQMKRAQGGLGAALSGSVGLSDKGFSDTLASNTSILNAYLDAHFDSSEVVQNKLTSLFTEAGQILADSQSSLNNIHSLTTANAGILANFASDIQSELTGSIYRSQTRPTTFKIGDIWIELNSDGQEVARYIATANSNETSGFGGWVQTSDGTLAQIKGAHLDIDAEDGNITIEAEKELLLRSNGLLKLVGHDVNITGEQSVNIGGPTLNLGAAAANGTPSSINLIATTYTSVGSSTGDTNFSKVLINPKKIEMGSADIIMRGTNKIQMVTSRGAITDTSVISISPADGVWIGSGAGVRLYSGNIGLTKLSDGTFAPVNGTGASVELLPTHLLFGVSNSNSSTTAVKMTDSYVVLGVGSAINATTNNKIDDGITGTSSGLIGAKFTKDSIGFATGSGNNINAILMNENGITIGSGSVNVTWPTTSNNNNNLRASRGSYTRISGEGIELGSLANLYVNMNNFKLQTNTGLGTRFAVGHNLQYITADSTATGLIANSNPALGDSTKPWVGLVFTNNNLFVSGSMYASSFIAKSNNGYMKADANNFGFYNNSGSAILTINSSGEISAAGNLKITSGNNLYIGSKTTNELYDANGAAAAVNTSLGKYMSGETSFTKIKTTGITIENNKLTIESTANISIQARGSISIGAMNNSNQYQEAIILNNDGIVIASNKKLTVDTTNFLLDTTKTSAQSTDAILRLGASSNPYLKYTIKNGLEITGKITATELTIGNKSAAQFVKDNQNTTDTSDFATWAAFNVDNAEGMPDSSVISANVWNSLGKGTALKMTDGSLQIGTTTNGAFTSDITINDNGISLTAGKYLVISTSNFGLTTDGTATINAGKIGNWTIENEWLYGGSTSNCVTLVGADAASHNTTDRTHVNLNTWAIYAGAAWPEEPGNSSLTNATPYGWAPFRVSRNGYVYGQNICVGNGPHELGNEVTAFLNRGQSDLFDGDWSNYTGYLWFWVEGTDTYTDSNGTEHNNEKCWRWIKIDGLQLYNMIESIQTLQKAVKNLQNSASVPAGDQVSEKAKSTRGCFVKGTLVKLYDNSFIPIEQLQVGMKVLAYNENDNKFYEDEVEVIQMLKHKNNIYDLYLSSGKKITMTGSHPILTTSGWKSLDIEGSLLDHGVEVTQLFEGDQIITCQNEPLYVNKIVFREDLQDETVYNCHIEKYHTFIVENAVVHNTFNAVKTKA